MSVFCWWNSWKKHVRLRYFIIFRVTRRKMLYAQITIAAAFWSVLKDPLRFLRSSAKWQVYDNLFRLERPNNQNLRLLSVDVGETMRRIVRTTRTACSMRHFIDDENASWRWVAVASSLPGWSSVSDCRVAGTVDKFTSAKRRRAESRPAGRRSISVFYDSLAPTWIRSLAGHNRTFVIGVMRSRNKERQKWETAMNSECRVRAPCCCVGINFTRSNILMIFSMHKQRLSEGLQLEC